MSTMIDEAVAALRSMIATGHADMAYDQTRCIVQGMRNIYPELRWMPCDFCGGDIDRKAHHCHRCGWIVQPVKETSCSKP